MATGGTSQESMIDFVELSKEDVEKLSQAELHTKWQELEALMTKCCKTIDGVSAMVNRYMGQLSHLDRKDNNSRAGIAMQLMICNETRRRYCEDANAVCRVMYYVQERLEALAGNSKTDERIANLVSIHRELQTGNIQAKAKKRPHDSTS